MNNDNFVIELNDIDYAQEAVCDIADSAIRNRAMANILGAMLASKYFVDADVNIDSGIHNVVKVLRETDVSDVYINGNYIDVRIYINDNELYVPKSHFNYNMLPVAYMFIKLDNELSAGNVMGFVFPEDIDTETDVNGYYRISEDILKSFYDIEQRIVITDDEGINTLFKENVYDFLDGKISGRNLYNTLVSSEIARKFLIAAASADSIFKSLDFEKLESDTDTVSESSVKSTEESNETLIESDEDLELEIEDDVEILNQVNAEDGDLIEIDSDVSQTEIEDFSDNIDSEGDDFLIDGDLEDDYIMQSLESDETSLVEQDSASENLAESSEYELDDNVSQTQEQTEYAESSIDNNVDEFDIEGEEHLVENENYTYDYETSGQFSQSPVKINNLKPQIVVYSDETDKNEDNEFKELSKFDYSTEIMPSISSIESGNNGQESVTEDMLESSGEKTPSGNYDEQQDSIENSEQIENLFGENPHKSINASKKKSSVMPFLTFIVLIAALGYWGYTKYYSPLPDVINNTNSGQKYEDNITAEEKEKPKEEAMPVETVENTQVTKSKEDASSVSIPAIEQNLSASVDVSNLSVSWEVPLSYVNNTTAKRYFVKIGKILQLNLKTEMLFLSNSPITNKISIELEFDKSGNKFVISKFVNSSGVVSIDNTIKNTVEKALNMNLNTNMSVFKNLQGSPVLVIKL